MSTSLIPGNITLDNLNTINIPQGSKENRENLEAFGGALELMKCLEVDTKSGLSISQVNKNREAYGINSFPKAPGDSYLKLLYEALIDPTLIILMCAAIASLAVGLYEGGMHWLEGAAILIAVFLVSNIQAANNYSKQLQFDALEKLCADDLLCSVIRDKEIIQINPADLVVGDILVLQTGDQIPADAVLIVSDSLVTCNESSLTGEPDDLKKFPEHDCFLLSSSLITQGDGIRALVIAVGKNSQWGKIKASLVNQSENTPLQDRLEAVTKRIGSVGLVAAIGVFAAMVISIWARNHGHDVAHGFIDAVTLAITCVVVSIPEGLPLAVTIALAFSMKKMYQDKCLIRNLSACETMGNATNICSDKTGTLTENCMTVVEAWFGDVTYSENLGTIQLDEGVRSFIIENSCINRTAYVLGEANKGIPSQVRPTIIGNKTEGALLFLMQQWGFDYNTVIKDSAWGSRTYDQLFPFNSVKKRSSGFVTRADGSVRLYCKGASECVLRDCTMYLDSKGQYQPLDSVKLKELENQIYSMAGRALRTLVLAHKDFKSTELPSDWNVNVRDDCDLCCDGIVGIIDPLRADVKEAVKVAQNAGIIVRMVTGDNIVTACAIARQCGILTDDGIALEGSEFRRMTPKALDAVLPRLQVLARSSPNDKFLLVTRLNGAAIPEDKAAWESFHSHVSDVSWEQHKDLLLPGYREEWESTRPEGGEVVSVTGDGTNDAPALKAANVGLAMGITGTKVAQSASDIVILDDRFSSIVQAIVWGRNVYDNIRKFVQFQFTVNIVALSLVFISACAGTGEPLTAIQMLWVNLVMDTLGAVSLSNEAPTPNLLNRRPYKRNASIISWVMWKNILVQAAYQLIVVLVLLFNGAELFGIISGVACGRYEVKNKQVYWDVATTQQVPYNSTLLSIVGCRDFLSYCNGNDNNQNCFEDQTNHISGDNLLFKFSELNDFAKECLTCEKNDYTHYTIIFNTFIFCQLFNEYTCRSISNEWNVFGGLSKNPIFPIISIFSVVFQYILVEHVGEAFKTSPLTISQWLISIALGFGGMIVGILMRFIPIEEDPASFADVNSLKTVKYEASKDTGRLVELTDLEKGEKPK